MGKIVQDKLTIRSITSTLLDSYSTVLHSKRLTRLSQLMPARCVENQTKFPAIT